MVDSDIGLALTQQDSISDATVYRVDMTAHERGAIQMIYDGWLYGDLKAAVFAVSHNIALLKSILDKTKEIGWEENK